MVRRVVIFRWIVVGMEILGSFAWSKKVLQLRVIGDLGCDWSPLHPANVDLPSRQVLPPVLITMPSSLFSLPRSTNSTPASINFFLTSLTSSSVKKHKSALPSLTRRALGSNSCHSHISSLSRANTNIDSSWSRMWVAPEAGTFPNSCKFIF